MAKETFSGQEGDREKMIATIKQRLQEGLTWQLEGDNLSDEDTRDSILLKAAVDLERILPDKSAVDAVLDVLGHIEFTDKKNFIDSFTTTLARLLMEHFSSAEALEERMRSVEVEENGVTRINELLTYELSDTDEIRLHVSVQFTATPLRLYNLLRQGFYSLAQKLLHDTSLAGVRKVCGTTWIAFENPGLAKRLGFTIMDRDESERVATVEMDRDAFLKRYG